jgi:LuxR family transcriptional activator of conjugal transfer of Ti plasmids
MIGSAKLYDVYRKSLVTEHLSWPDIERVKDVNAQAMLADDFVGFLTRLTQQLGFDYFSYALGYIDGRCNGNVYDTRILSNFTRDWVVEYDGGNYREIDPVNQFSKRAWSPFIWGQREDLACLSRDSRAVMEAGVKVGMRMGISLPAHGPGGEYLVLTMSTSEREPRLADLVRQNYNLLQLIAPTVHATAMQRFLPQSPLYDVTLTEGERECLSWTARGKTSWEIAHIISRSKATVEYHLQKAMRKLNAVTKAQAAALALKYGLL